eukprot:2891500-Rhodomonas_salina.1
MRSEHLAGYPGYPGTQRKTGSCVPVSLTATMRTQAKTASAMFVLARRYPGTEASSRDGTPYPNIEPKPMGTTEGKPCCHRRPYADSTGAVATAEASPAFSTSSRHFSTRWQSGESSCRWLVGRAFVLGSLWSIQI